MLDECRAVRPFAGGEWADDATMDGQRAGRQASGQERLKKPMVKMVIICHVPDIHDGVKPIIQCPQISLKNQG